MLSKLQKLSKDIIIYSVLISDYEKLDFKNDALAGVRANYFNSNLLPQSDKTDIELDGRMLSLTYSMRKSEPLSWKITKNNQPYQTVKLNGDGSYCVISYSDNGVVYKRIYFDGEHRWVRTDYFNRDIENSLLSSVTPCVIKGIIALRHEKILENGAKTQSILFPSEVPASKRCGGLIYSNAGMLWYDTTFRPTEIGNEYKLNEEAGGFSFRPEDFTISSSSPLDLKNAEYLSRSDTDNIKTVICENIPDEEKPYSAYDKIASILFEAHKTNKNIFGEVISHAGEDEAKAEEIEKTVEQIDETPSETHEETVETIEETAENSEEVVETFEEAVKTDEEKDYTEYKVEEYEDSDLEIKTPNGVYTYYGELDKNNQRIGRGRTVSPGGTTVYDGEYSLDKRNGFGICYYKDGSPNYVGDWQNGSRSGRGVGFRQSDGTVHVGKWVENAPSGIGARFDSEGRFIDVCRYESGVRNGKSISFDENGNVVIRIWDNGELISEQIISDEG